MTHDQLFKAVLQEFFQEFLELFYPDVARRLDFGRVTFLDKEAFTDMPEGVRREADLAVQVYTRDGQPEIILVHVEVQAQRRSDFPYRMFEYYALFRLRHRLPVFPIAVYLAPGAGGLVDETYAESLFGNELLRFCYKVVGLPDLDFAEYVPQANPLASALSALMKPGASGNALRKAMILRQQAIIESNEARRTLLLTLIERYMPLDTDQEAEFRKLVETPEYAEAKMLINPYEERGMQQGMQQGVQQGLQQGMQQGVQQGMQQQGRLALLAVLQERFGAAASRNVLPLIEAITEPAELNALLRKAVTAPSLEDLGLAQ